MIHAVRLVHMNLSVADPEASAAFYRRVLLPHAASEWLGDSLHLRGASVDLAFQAGPPDEAAPWHFGFLAPSSGAVDDVRTAVMHEGISLTDDTADAGLRSIKFRDPDGYECEVYWEDRWAG